MANQTPRKRVVYVLLALVLGWCGAHNFYAGYTNRGIWFAVIGVVGLLFVIPTVVVWIVAIRDALSVRVDGSGVTMLDG